MDPESHLQSLTPRNVRTYHGFWPVLLMGLSLVMVFSWEIRVGYFTRVGTQKLQEQQVHLVDEAKRVQASLEKLVRNLVDLSKTDEAAEKLVTKFGIKVNEPALPDATPFP